MKTFTNIIARPARSSLDGSFKFSDSTPKYGLPEHVKYCSTCVISNQRPNSTVETVHTTETKKKTISFDKDNICDACNTARLKEGIDWVDRDLQLRELCDKYRSRDGSYDCMIPGSGGKDSFYQAHILKNKYGMNPLTITWAPHLYTDWGWRNFQRWIHSGFDNILVTPNGKIHRLITRLAVDNLFHPFQPFIIGQKCLAPKLAYIHNIKLVFYGENEAEYGNPLADNMSSQRDFKYFTASSENEIFLGGTSIQSLKKEFNVSKADLDMYLPIDPNKVNDAGIQIHYLGYYLKWHPQEAYYYAHKHGGFEASPERTVGTYSKYNSIDDKIDDFHYFTTFIKFGIGRASYDASQEIRSGEIDRQEGVALVHKFDGEFPERFSKEIFQYLSIPKEKFGEVSQRFEQPVMDREYFEDLTNQFRSPHLWRFTSDGWKLKHTVE